MSKEQSNGNGNGNGYPPELWAKVEHDYQFTPRSVAAISRTYGPTRQAIMKHMDSRGIRRDMASDVKDTTSRKIIERELHHDVTPENYDRAIEEYGEVGAGVVSAHKELFNQVLQQIGVTVEDLSVQQDIINQLAAGERIRKNVLAAARLALANRDKTLRTIAYVLDKLVPLQRQAFGLDGESGTTEAITYIIVGDLEKPRDAGMSGAVS